jgi:hypothetical protein
MSEGPIPGLYTNHQQDSAPFLSLSYLFLAGCSNCPLSLPASIIDLIYK